MSPDDIAQVGFSLATYLAFGPHGETIERQASITAVLEGVEMACVENGISPSHLVDNLTSAALIADEDEDDEPLTMTAIVTDLFANRTVVRASQVIRRLRVRGGSGHSEAEGHWIRHLKRYLRGGRC